MPLPHLAFIGGGTMARAIIQGALGAELIDPGRVVVADPDQDKRRSMARLGCAVVPAADEAARWLGDRTDGQIVLAIKPQVFGAVAAQIGRLSDPIVVISIMAGVSSERINAGLGPRARIIRVMPNTPARVGAGATAVAMGAGARPGDDAVAMSLFGAVGPVVVRIDESLMDAFTAVAGSGPAYAFYLAEAMIEAGASLGLDAQVARRVVGQVIAGAGVLLVEDGADPASLRAAVTSKGGTTAAAMSVLEQERVAQTIVRAVTAAKDRGRQLSEQASDAPPGN